MKLRPKPLGPQIALPFAPGWPGGQGLVVDNFAGGGGASTALTRALGHAPDVAINHDAKALAMHAANHPETEHRCESVWAVDPHEACSGRAIDIGWFSPDCTHFSQARGGKPRDKNIRALAHVVTRWTSLPEWQRPKVVFVENVVEFLSWGPLLPDGKPDPEKLGWYFHRWIERQRKRGYIVEWKEIRSCDFGGKTIRKRLFIIMRRDGRPIVWPPATHYNPKAARAPELRLHLAPYRTAAECIDWSLPVRSIFGRKRPLADNTLRRIARGVMRYVVLNATPFIVPVTHSSGVRVHPLDEPMRTITTAKGGELALVSPSIISVAHGDSGGRREYPIDDPLGTVAAGGRSHALVAAHINVNRNSQKPYNGADEPLHTVTAQGAHLNLVAAFLAQFNNHRGVEPSAGHDIRKPMSTISTVGPHQGLAAATLVNLKGAGGMRGEGPVDAPMPTVCAQGTHVAEVRAFLLKYFGTATGAGLDEPMHTATAKPRFGLVTVEGVEYHIVDIGFRMLTPRELFRAQGFPDDYIIDPVFEGKRLTIADQVEKCGNSVAVEPAEALIRANNPRLPLAEVERMAA